MSENNINNVRIQKLLNLPDLSRKENSPIKFVVDRILAMEDFKNFDIIKTPEVVSVEYNFDLLNTPQNHPSRQKTDTYYVDDNHVLRTHTTVMWPYYLLDKNGIKKLRENGLVGALSFGKVFRKDEIDRNHFPIFHQIDGFYICRKKEKVIELGDLKKVLADIVKNVYGEKIEYRFLVDSFPFTDPSAQIEIKVPTRYASRSDAGGGEKWLEVVGCGLVHTKVLKNLGIDPEIYNGWAFGFGIERLAMVKMNILDIRIFWAKDERITSQFKNLDSQYKEVSKFPMTYRDISFVIDKNINLNSYYEVVRDCAGNLVEEVKLADKYEDKEKFGKDKISYTFRIVYRSPERTLTNEEINEIQEKIREKTEKELQALLR